MTMRIERDVRRGGGVRIWIDGREVAAFVGETVATAMLAAGRIAVRSDTKGRPRGLFCNMGTCSECFVAIRTAGDAPARRLRACLTPVGDGMQIRTGLPCDD